MHKGSQDQQGKPFSVISLYQFMKRSILLILILFCYPLTSGDWTESARIADVDFSTDFTDEEIREGIDIAHEQGISVIMVWVTSNNIDIPSKDLDALRKAVSYTHQTYPDMRLVVYQAPLEIITENVDKNKDGNIDSGAKALSTEHPEWLQVGIDGRKAVFYGDIEVWIGEYDEDVWLCPNDPVYKKKIKESIRQLAATGIDGIWIDVVRFLCTFGDWDSNWACHCEDCQQKFERDTGFDIPDEITWDTTWKIWLQWRQQCIEDFIEEISSTAKEVNPFIQLIVEHWLGFDAESTQDAWNPLGLQTVTDVLAHEYISASEYIETYSPVNYVRDIALYQFYRGIDHGHPSWILAYSQRKDGQKMLAASVLQAGCNFYDTVYSDIDESVSLDERKRIFHWIKKYSSYYYGVTPVSNVAVYYSRPSIDFYDCPKGDWEFYREFVGVSMMLLQMHIPYTVITSIEENQADIVILPHVVCLSDAEKEGIQQFLDNGGYVLSTGKTGYYDEMGNKRLLPVFFQSLRFYSTETLPGNEYYDEVEPYFWPDERETQGTGSEVQKEFSTFLKQVPFIDVDMASSGTVIVYPFISGSNLVYRVLNLDGISPGKAVPDPQTISLTITRPVLNASVIPFLSEPAFLEVETSTATFLIEDHCLLLLEVEPVGIYTNEYDLPAAEKLRSFLQARGIPVQFVTSPEKSSILIVFGGHKAEKTGDFVSSLLTDQQKNQLEQPNSQNIFIFRTDRLIIVIAGNEREDTARSAEEKRREIFELL